MPARAPGWIVAALLCASACAPAAARADAALLPAEPTADQRISAELSASLREEASAAFTWRLTWTGINGAVALASVGGVFILPESQHPSLIVGAISSGISAALTWFLPLEVEANAEHAEQLGSLPPGQRRARLEALYAHSAEDESDRVQWPWHLVSVLTAVVPAAIIWIGWDQPQEATITLLTGLALGELAILTQPTGLSDRAPPTVGALQVAFTGRDARFTYTLAW